MILLHDRSRFAAYLTIVGIIIALAGLGLDAWLHSQPDRPHEESLFTLANPGHLIFGTGLILAASGGIIGLWPSGPARRRDTAVAATLAFLIVLGGSALISYGLLAEPRLARVEDHDHDRSQAIVDDLKRRGIDDETIALIETSRHEHGPEIAASSRDLIALGKEVEVANRVAARFASIEAALSEGYFQITQDLPLIGGHFINLQYAADGRFDLERPEMIIYGYQGGQWRLFGLSYLTALVGRDDEQPPEGFSGPFDRWHWHANWCFSLNGAAVTDADGCAERRGLHVERTGFMVHFWVVENPEGMFAHSHSGLTGSDEYVFYGTKSLGR